MLNRTRFAVKQQSKMLMAKGVYDILDGDTGEVIGTASQVSGLVATLIGLARGSDKKPITVEVRQKSDNALIFSVKRTGLLFMKVQVFDAAGKVVGRYKAKRFSLAGGFHVYDANGKHFAEIRGKMFRAEYKFLTPDGTQEMGIVSKKPGGGMKEFFSGAETYGVEIGSGHHSDDAAKMLILGAALAVDAIFAAGGKGGKAEKDEDEADKAEDE